MNRSVCAGCGQPLPQRGIRRGRRARYHGLACRQRAQRAHRVGQARRLIAAAEAAEAAAAAVRAAANAGKDTAAAVERLQAAAATVAQLVAATPDTAATGAATSPGEERVNRPADAGAEQRPSGPVGTVTPLRRARARGR